MVQLIMLIYRNSSTKHASNRIFTKKISQVLILHRRERLSSSVFWQLTKAEAAVCRPPWNFFQNSWETTFAWDSPLITLLSSSAKRLEKETRSQVFSTNLEFFKVPLFCRTSPNYGFWKTLDWSRFSTREFLLCFCRVGFEKPTDNFWYGIFFFFRWSSAPLEHKNQFLKLQ